MVFRCLSTLLLVLLWGGIVQAGSTPKSYTVGILAFQPQSITSKKWSVLATYLKKSSPDTEFTIVPLSASQLEEAIQIRSVDFVLTNPSQFIRFKHLYGLSTPLATVVRGARDNPLHAFGGVIFTLAQNSQIKSLADLKERRIAVPFDSAFGAFQVQQYELYLKELPLVTPEQLVITGLPHDNMVMAVQEGRADVGFARAGTLERMAAQGKIELEHFKVINRQPSAYPVQLSTHLYPEWPFAAMPHVNPDKLGPILVALLQISSEHSDILPFNVLGFRLPADYAPVEELMRSIRAVPFDHVPDVYLADIWLLYKWEIIIAVIAVLIITLLTFRLILSNRLLMVSQQHLQAGMERLELALEGGKLGTWDWDIDNGEVLYCERWADIVGYRLSEIPPRLDGWTSLLHPEDLQETMRIMDEHIQGHTQLIYTEHRLRHKDGHYLWTLGVGRVCERDEQGQPVRAVGVQMDISKHKELEIKLQQSQSRLQTLLDVASDGIHVIDHKGDMVECSKSFANMLGYSDKEVVQMNVADWDATMPREQLLQKIRELMKEPATFETKHLCKDGTVIDVEISAKGVVLDRQLLLYASSRDISERKKAELLLLVAKEAAEKANNAKSVFLSNMSHELRTPLNAILGYTQLFADDAGLSEKQQAGVRTIHNAGEHLLMLINDILDLAKIEAGKLELIPGEIALESFLRTLGEIIQVRSKAKGLEFHLDLDEQLPVAIMADELRLRQVLLNLLSNAVKFTDKGYCLLRVSSTRLEEEKVQLGFIVEDSGPGIAEEMQEQVFDAFQQSGERLKYAEGSGLGLSICRQLVRLMQGELTLISPVNAEASQQGGPGCRFVFSAAFHASRGAVSAPPRRLQTSFSIAGMQAGTKKRSGPYPSTTPL